MRKIIILIMVLVLLTIFFQFSKPKIKINNMTHHDVFVFYGASEKGVDPDYEQIKQSRHAVKIPQGESMEASINLSDYLLHDGQVNIGWRVGGLADRDIRRVGYNTFNIISGSKHCYLKIDIKDSKDEIFYQNKIFCIMSLEVTSNEDN